MTTYINFPEAVAIGGLAALVFFFSGVAILALCKAADKRDEIMDNEPLPTEVAGEYHEPTGPALHRLADMKFRFMACGHHVWHWSDYKQACLQCVLEGRQAARDMGRQG